jgi:hypothetical protein
MAAAMREIFLRSQNHNSARPGRANERKDHRMPNLWDRETASKPPSGQGDIQE